MGIISIKVRSTPPSLFLALTHHDWYQRHNGHHDYVLHCPKYKSNFAHPVHSFWIVVTQFVVLLEAHHVIGALHLGGKVYRIVVVIVVTSTRVIILKCPHCYYGSHYLDYYCRLVNLLGTNHISTEAVGSGDDPSLVEERPGALHLFKKHCQRHNGPRN